ncbi:MAG TPA: AAA family ATPase, partial [Nannocystis sp.]
ATLREMGIHSVYPTAGALVVTVRQAGSATDQAALAARVALLIDDRWRAASVAVLTGRGMTRGNSTVGEVADRAALMLQRSPGDSSSLPHKDHSGVWLDELTARLLGPEFTVTRTGEYALLLGEEKDVDASRPLLGKPTPCVGRDSELGTLEAQLDACIADAEARAVIVTAPSGTGKSRLRHEFMRRLHKRDEPVTQVFGRGDMIGAGAPYGILAQALRRFCGLGGGEAVDEQRRRLRTRLGRHLAPADQERVCACMLELVGVSPASSPTSRAAHMDPALMHKEIRRAFLDWLAVETAAAPVLLVLDDLQWGDALTVALVDEALRKLEGAPLFVLALARPELHEVFPRLWQGHRAQEIALKGLGKKACERLIQQVLGKQVPAEVMARAVERSAGNALFLEEMIRAIAEGKSSEPDEAPEAVLAILQARIGRFEVGPRRAVRAAAVFGQTFWQGGVAAVLGQPRTGPGVEAWLATLVEQEVIERRADSRLGGEVEYGFRHALVQEVAYSLLTESDLATGHQLAGEFLVEAGERDATQIAEHFVRAGVLDRAVTYYMKAGQEAVSRSLLREARTSYAAAKATIERLPELPEHCRQHADILLMQVKTGVTNDPAEVNLQRIARARELLESVMRSGAALPEDRLRMARVEHYRARAQCYGGQQNLAEANLRALLPIAEEFRDHELATTAGFTLGLSLMLQGKFGQARDTFAGALPVMERLFGTSIDTMRCCMYYAMVLSASGRPREAAAQVARATRWAQALEQPMYTSVFHMTRMLGAALAADWPATLEAGEALGDASKQAGETMFLHTMLDGMSWAQSYLGQCDLAVANVERSAELKRSLGLNTIGQDWWDAAAADVLLNAGRTEQALARAQQIAAGSQAIGLHFSHALAERVWACALSRLGGAAAEVDRHFATSLQVALPCEQTTSAIQTRLWWGRICRERGDEAAATDHFEQAIAALEASGHEFALDAARHLAGMPSA